MGLRCAIPKGRPMEDLLPYFEALGGARAWRDVSRKLILVDEELDITFFLAKSMDVPTYVEYGAADIGIAGKDVLLEHDKRVVELLDLRLSQCELIVAVPDDSGVQKVTDLHFNSRVATKYPRVAEAFFNSKGIQVEIIPMNGSIELAPLVGLADAILDVTQTGRTLRENGLRIVGSVAKSSLRLIANPVSYKVEFARIRELVDKMRRLVEAEVQVS
ncbi:MAG TPA: ATP phosphoribosyltransferase [Limnochordia bacterium]|nr:ATP phosphoribosyltransferase [Limnochordia bacterium]